MRLGRATIALYMLLVFASGAALGLFGERYYAAKQAAAEASKNRSKRPPTPEEFRKQYLAGMQKQLLLSEEQVQKLSNIMDETRVLMDEMHKRNRPEEQAIQRAQNEKIRNLFDDVQREKYDAMLKRMSERNRNKNKNRQGGGF